MSDINDGGAAFPSLDSYWNENEHQFELGESISGMTLRDYFAVKAMQGLIASPRAPIVAAADITDRDYARLAYVMADAMLKARQA